VDTSSLEPELMHYQGHRWANPSEADLRKALRRVQQQPEEARQKGAKAREHVLRHYSRQPVTGRMIARLAAIECKLTVPTCPPTRRRSQLRQLLSQLAALGDPMVRAHPTLTVRPNRRRYVGADL
jgi:hypothetical protein